MQEESTQRTVALMIRTSRLTESILKKAMIMYLREANNRPETHGRISVRKLLGKDQGANTMEINNANIRTFNRVAARYNIDYAIQKDKTQDPPKYVVFFKGRDADVISRAFKDFCDLNERKRNRVSLIEKLKKLKEAKIEKAGKARKKEKNIDREESR
ncbi:MAG: PcfB family protein [Lachnospiraceae bacterium]|nr:PcfB family protein [Lachnospiraceae bacterium]